MCLITPLIEPILATEDIIVYKELNEDGTSRIHKFPYILGEIYETDFTFDKKRIGRQLQYHDWYAMDALSYNYDPKICVVEGFHSYGSYHRAIKKKYDPIPKWRLENIYECVIPKGATYYKDLSDLLVSNKIIINTKVRINGEIS